VPDYELDLTTSWTALRCATCLTTSYVPAGRHSAALRAWLRATCLTTSYVP